MGGGCGKTCHQGERGQRPQGGRYQRKHSGIPLLLVREARSSTRRLWPFLLFFVGCVSTGEYKSTACRQSQAEKLHCRHAIFLAQWDPRRKKGT
ncbi:hypothetical protein RHECNPAF_1700093 [Rhizobium etli CNPAF512]|nr:hypothetical protein RHECNPAF_1700093 [Rhizobium etli CNPAF512]